jgi:sodium-dependent dicarboxylate transporter 2/3/5
MVAINRAGSDGIPETKTVPWAAAKGARLIRPPWMSADARRLFFMGLGIIIFCAIYFSPAWPAATEPGGEAFILTHQGKASVALFFLAATWWVFEVLPIGITAVAVGVLQTLFLIRPAKVAFGDFMDPSVLFIFGSLMIGKVFTQTGLTKRMAYKMLVVVGERTRMIYLGAFMLTVLLTFVMAHTAVAATIFPLLMSIYALYEEEEDGKPTRFGKGLFIGMAFAAGAGSIVTLLGSARAAVAIGFFKDIAGHEISFFELTYYMFPVGMIMVILIWIFISIVFKPERDTIPGLRQRAHDLYAKLGPVTRREWLSLLIVLGTVATMIASSFIANAPNKSAVILVATILFFVFRIIDLNDLEEIPWNIVLLFGGAMSIGICLWDTGAARWIALKWLILFQSASAFWFVLSVAFLVLIMTNFIMNVAAIAITLPVAILMAQYLNVAPEVVLFSSLVTAGMPFLFLIGAAPNAIAYESRQFKSGEFFLVGLPASLLLILVLSLFVLIIWPAMGMPVVAP